MALTVQYARHQGNYSRLYGMIATKDEELKIAAIFDQINILGLINFSYSKKISVTTGTLTHIYSGNDGSECLQSANNYINQ